MPKSLKEVPRTCWLEPDIDEAFRLLAALEGRSVSGYLRYLVHRELNGKRARYKIRDARRTTSAA